MTSLSLDIAHSLPEIVLSIGALSLLMLGAFGAGKRDWIITEAAIVVLGIAFLSMFYPIADKALLVSIYVSLAVVGVLPAAIAILVVSRDLMIVSAVLVSWVMDKPVAIRPLLVSKLNTLAQIAFATLVLLAKAAGWETAPWLSYALYVVATLTLASALAYLVQWLRHMELY